MQIMVAKFIVSVLLAATCIAGISWVVEVLRKRSVFDFVLLLLGVALTYVIYINVEV